MKRLLPLLLLLACHHSRPPVSVGSTGNQTGTDGPSPVIVTLERTACYGTCPIYKVALHADGTVDWHGEQYVAVVGDAHGKVGADQVAALEQAFQAAGYDQLKDAYDNRTMTDQPSVITSHTGADGKTKGVNHYLGDKDAPRALSDLENKIDDTLGTKQWIGSGEPAK